MFVVKVLQLLGLLPKSGKDAENESFVDKIIGVLFPATEGGLFDKIWEKISAAFGSAPDWWAEIWLVLSKAFAGDTPDWWTAIKNRLADAFPGEAPNWWNAFWYTLKTAFGTVAPDWWSMIWNIIRVALSGGGSIGSTSAWNSPGTGANKPRSDFARAIDPTGIIGVGNIGESLPKQAGPVVTNNFYGVQPQQIIDYINRMQGQNATVETRL